MTHHYLLTNMFLNEDPMLKYKVFFQLYGTKMCKEVMAMDKYDAENMIRDELLIDEVRKMDNEPEPKPTNTFNGENVEDVLMSMFGGFKK